MKIIDQSHEIISLPDNLLQAIEVAGRTCYKSEDKIGCTLSTHFNDMKKMEGELKGLYCDINWGNCSTNCEYHSSQKFTKRLLDRGHHAMIEFGDIIVRFVTNRGVTHELVRHRLCSFAQESTRYVRYDGQMKFIRPVWCSDKIVGTHTSEGAFLRSTDHKLSIEDEYFIEACIDAERYYTLLLKKGWRPEQAREVLPNSLKTEIVVKANVREVRHILNLRCAKNAHPQIRHLMLPLLKELNEKVPILFDDIYNKYIGDKDEKTL